MADQATSTYRQEFGPELAGEIVGWVGVTEKDEQYVHLCVALGVVGAQGAGYVIDNSGYSSYPDTSYGFEHVVGVHVNSQRGADEILTVDNSDIFREEESDFSRPLPYERGTLTLVEPYDLFSPDQLVVEQGTWHVANKEIVDGIKRALDERDARWLYPRAYYSLAYASNDDYLLSDWDMHGKTKAEKAIMLQNQYDNDQALWLDANMQRNLTVFGDPHVTADNIAELFTESRQKMTQLETSIATRSLHSAMANFVPPIGIVKNGWKSTLLAVAAESERDSFGLEIDRLLNGSIEPAHSKLQEELIELLARKAVINKLSTKLAALSHKEKANLS